MFIKINRFPESGSELFDRNGGKVGKTGLFIFVRVESTSFPGEGKYVEEGHICVPRLEAPYQKKT